MQSEGNIERQFQGQPALPVGGAAQVVYARKSGSTMYNHYNKFQSKLTGAAQIAFGIPLILTNITLLMTDYRIVNVIGHGIWGGLILVVSGIIGIVASARKTKCLAITYMIMCIVACLILIPVVIFGGFGVYYGFECRYYAEVWEVCVYGPEFSEAFHIMMLVFSVLGGIGAIWGSTLCCRAAPCCSDDKDELVPMHIFTADGNQKIVHGNSSNDYLKPSALEGYEKLHLDTGDEVYDTIKDDDVKDDLDLDHSGYERCQRSAIKKTENIPQNEYEKINLIVENEKESQVVADYDKLIGSSNKKDDLVSSEKLANDYLVLEAEGV